MKQSKEFYQAQLQMLNAMSQEAFNEMYTAGYYNEVKQMFGEGENPDQWVLKAAKEDVFYCAVNAQAEFMAALFHEDCNYNSYSMYDLACSCGMYAGEGKL